MDVRSALVGVYRRQLHEPGLELRYRGHSKLGRLSDRLFLEHQQPERVYCPGWCELQVLLKLDLHNQRAAPVGGLFSFVIPHSLRRCQETKGSPRDAFALP